MNRLHSLVSLVQQGVASGRTHGLLLVDVAPAPSNLLCCGHQLAACGAMLALIQRISRWLRKKVKLRKTMELEEDEDLLSELSSLPADEPTKRVACQRCR